MILTRLGNKTKIAKDIIKHFPRHTTYVDVTFGAGGMFFNKPKAKYNIVNDLDSDVFNLFQVIINQKESLREAFEIMPIHSDLLEYWKKNKEKDPIKKSLRFLLLSNFTYLGKGTNIRYGQSNDKRMFLSRLDKTFNALQNVQFNNCDFERFLKSINFRCEKDKEKTFIYGDPPYIDTGSNYENKSWSKNDFCRLLDACIATGCKFAISEFNNEFVIKEAEKRELNIIYIGERVNIKNRRTEILITNYKTETTLF